jgi:VanZ family protein
MLGWKTEHFLGFLTVTFIASFAWRRTLLVGLTFMATAGLLEALQGLTPNRIPDLPTALSGAGGALLGSVAAEVFMRARRSAAKAFARSERDKIK